LSILWVIFLAKMNSYKYKIKAIEWNDFVVALESEKGAHIGGIFLMYFNFYIFRNFIPNFFSLVQR